MKTHELDSTLLPTTNSYSTAWQKYLSFIDSQKNYAFAWLVIGLLLNGGILVPLTFLFVYAFGGPVAPFLFISLLCFFSNFVASMSSAPFRANFNLLVFSVLVHISMIVITLAAL